MIVADASVVLVAMAFDDDNGEVARRALGRDAVGSPHHLDVEVVNGLRRLVRLGNVDLDRATLAIEDLRTIDIVRTPLEHLLARIWALRDNVSAYDAAYVALAEALDCTLVTSDGRLANASGIRCTVEVLATPA